MGRERGACAVGAEETPPAQVQREEPSSLPSSERSEEAILLQQTVRARLQNGKQPSSLGEAPGAGNAAQQASLAGKEVGRASTLAQTWRKPLATVLGRSIKRFHHDIAKVCSALGRSIRVLFNQMRMLWQHRYAQAVRWRLYQGLRHLVQWISGQVTKIGVLLQNCMVRMLGPELSRAIMQLCFSMFALLWAVCLVAKCFLLQFVAPSIYQCLVFIQRVYRRWRVGAIDSKREHQVTTAASRAPVQCATWSPGKESTQLASIGIYKGQVATLGYLSSQQEASESETEEELGSRPQASAPNWSAVADQVDLSTMDDAQLRPHSLPRRFKRRKERAVLQLIDFDDTSL
ncbi:hypothetical protein CCYA_CCYA04G1422 [Cyanidiococcus yangmingshanensis]|nr:hypothetical protein CCYA_CCYA04G1422 [Cyanidiococcus yangmingshanensis]